MKRAMTSMMIRTYSEMSSLFTFEERFDYLKLGGEVGKVTFGFERYINQRFYNSTEWKRVRSFVIARDLGLDLGAEGREIYDRILVHHMNPMSSSDLNDFNSDILDPEFLITVSHPTHNAIHYGASSPVQPSYSIRSPGDTKFW